MNGCALVRKANLLAKIRSFFSSKNVIEVSTPLLRNSTTTDVHIESIKCVFSDQQRWLQTSPENAMKILLSKHPEQSIYQICKAFRDDPTARWHRHEFTLVEWYRLDFDIHALMSEVHALIEHCGEKSIKPRFMSYRDAFSFWAQIDPFTASAQQLKQRYFDLNGTPVEGVEPNDLVLWQQLILTHIIEPHLSDFEVFFLYDFPKHSAVMAKIETCDASDSPPIAKRFECYLNGIEVAHGYEELRFAEEYTERMQADNKLRQSQNKPSIPMDTELLEQLKINPLPATTGVALGFDRLLALLAGANNLYDTI